MRPRYTIHSQGSYGGPSFTTRAEAVKAVREAVKADRVACRRHFRQCHVEAWKATVWEVRAGRDPAMPMWSRYSIHATV